MSAEDNEADDDERRRLAQIAASAGSLAPRGSYGMPSAEQRARNGVAARLRASLGDLTRGERLLWWCLFVSSMFLPGCAVLLAALGHGSTRSVGVALLFVSLALVALPWSAVFKARIRRRAKRATKPR